MPEGPQVARYARLQSEKLCGKIVRADSPSGRSDEVAALVDGATLRGIEAVGKHLLYDFGEDRLLHVHLGRFGNFHTGTLPLPEIRGIVRFRLYTDTDWYELRGAIAVEIFDASMRALLEDRIGPNPLDPAADPMRAYAKIVKSRTAVGLQMMDQSIVGGIGNIYRSEVLFLNRVNPRDPGPTLERKTWRAMWADLARVMADGAVIGRIVTTWPKDRTKKKGAVARGDRFYVYHRTGLPCRRCGTLVCTETLGTRSVFWCPACQRPTTKRASAASAGPKPVAAKKRAATKGKKPVKKAAEKPVKKAAGKSAKQTVGKIGGTGNLRSARADDRTL